MRGRFAFSLPALLLALALPVHAQAPGEPIRMTLKPIGEPIPALKHLLLPDLDMQTPGNAALCYHRALGIRAQKGKELDDLEKKIDELIAQPLTSFNKQEASKLLADEKVKGVLHELQIAATRRDCSWGVEFREEGYTLLLPELQGVRSLVRYPALQARLAIAERQFEKAVSGLRVGYAMARHASDAPNLISNLVGMAIATVVTRQFEDLMQQPDVPNFYWSLTLLPHPFVSVYSGMQGEKALPFRGDLPRLQDLTVRPLTTPEVEKQIETTMQLIALEGEGQQLTAAKLKEMVAGNVKRDYPVMKKRLLSEGYASELVEKMSPIQVVLIASLEDYIRLRDDMLKWTYVPYWQSIEPIKKVLNQLPPRTEEGIPLARALLPALDKVTAAEGRVERRFAALRCIEALRLQANANGGKWPTRLEEVTIVPVPLDPMTGKQFEFSVQGTKATIKGPTVSDPKNTANTLVYEIELK